MHQRISEIMTSQPWTVHFFDDLHEENGSSVTQCRSQMSNDVASGGIIGVLENFNGALQIRRLLAGGSSGCDA